MKRRPGSRAVFQVVLSVALVFGGKAALGHQDMVIKLAPDGQLQGLPSEYQPARLHLPDSGTEHVVLLLGQNRLEFPDCLSVLFEKSSKFHMQITASWYHDPRILPPYVSIRLPTTVPNAMASMTAGQYS